MLAVLLAMFGCTDAPPAGDSGVPADVVQATCGPEGGTQHWAIDSLAFARIDGDVSEGFDLDGVVSTTGGSSGCGIADLTGPDGTEGVDNAFGRLLPVLDNTEFIAAEGLIAASIANGELLLIPELAGLDDPTADDCVQMALRRGSEAPMMGTDGSLLAGQTLDLDPDFDDQVFTERPVVDGRVEGRPMTVALPLQILNADLVFELRDGALRYDLLDDGALHGAMAGGIETAAIRTMVETEGVNDELRGLVDSLLDSVADLAPDAAGQCQQISVVLEFTAVPVHVFDDAI